MYACPKGHNSTESDFCSECGAKIIGLGVAELTSQPTGKVAMPPVAGTAIVQPCPECNTPHEVDSGNFCEICGYNFATGAKGGDPLSIFPPPIRSAVTTATAPTQPPTPVTKVAGKWQLVISIDPSLATPDSPPPPNQAPISIELHHPINAIGRTSQSRAIFPEIALDLDDAVSSRHAILTLHPDGRLVLRDIGSSNGTMVNGKEIAMMADIPISSGDEISLGHWTRLKLTNFV